MLNYAILKNRKVIPVDDVLIWGRWLDENNHLRIVAQETLPNKLRVSTVFLGLNHSFGEGEPLWFETMVFSAKGYAEEDMDRYTTWNEAIKGHKKMVQKWS